MIIYTNRYWYRLLLWEVSQNAMNTNYNFVFFVLFLVSYISFVVLSNMYFMCCSCIYPFLNHLCVVSRPWLNGLETASRNKINKTTQSVYIEHFHDNFLSVCVLTQPLPTLLSVGMASVIYTSFFQVSPLIY